MSEQERMKAGLDKREAELAERERELKTREEAANRRLRDNLYDKIPVSVGTMNIVIAVLSAALVVLIAVGIIQGAG